MEALPLLVGRLALRTILAVLVLCVSWPLDAQEDRRIDGVLHAALGEASRKLADVRCRQVLTDFTDAAGRRLDDRLAGMGQEMPAYLGSVFFVDGSATRPCADRQVLAWTTPGSRAVSVCPDQFTEFQRGRIGDAANLLIHETLHTLGLREGPPDAREITARVQSRCGR